MHGVRSVLSLGQGHPVEVERFHHPLQHALDPVVDCARREGQELGGHLGQQRFEPEALSQAALRPPALGAAREQADDEGALHDEQRGAARDVPLVEVPGRRRPETDDAARGQPSLVESPAPELPPVEHVPVVCGLDDGNGLGSFPAEDS